MEKKKAQPTSLATMGIKIQTQLRFHLTPVRMPVGERHMLVRMQGERKCTLLGVCRLASAEIAKGGSSKTSENTRVVAN